MASSAANVMLDPVGLLLLPHYPTSLIPAKLLRRMLRSRIWQQYQSGHLSFQAATSRLAQLPFMSSHSSWTPCDIAGVLQNRTLTPTPWMLQLLDTLRHKLHLRLLCLCNASPDELPALQAQFPSLFARFDATFSSGGEGLVRPSVRFFEVALSKAHVHPQDSFYLDSWDSFESITAARSLGMHALLLPKAKMDKWSGALPPADHGLIQDILVRFSSPPTGPVQFLMLHCPLLRDLESSSTISGYNICSSVASKVEQNDPQISDGAMTKCLQVTLRRDKSFAADRRSKAQALGWKYLLETGAQDPEKPFQHPTLTSDGIRIHDNFTQFLIADMLNDDRFLPMQLPPLHGLICFMDRSSYLRKNDAGDGSINMQYYQSDASALEDIPEDLDATSIGLSVLHKFGKADRETINQALDMMLKHRSEDDGIVQVYFDKERPRIDPVVVGNVVFLFHLANRGEEVEKSESFVESVLLHSAYQEGTLYYNLPEAFLWCVAKLMHRFKEHFGKRRPRMRALLAARLREVESNTGGALALAMRMHAFSLCGGRGDEAGRDDVDEGQHAARADEWEEELVQLQRADGSWECEPFYRYGSNARSSFTNEALSTAFALAALSQYAP